MCIVQSFAGDAMDGHDVSLGFSVRKYVFIVVACALNEIIMCRKYFWL